MPQVTSTVVHECGIPQLINGETKITLCHFFLFHRCLSLRTMATSLCRKHQHPGDISSGRIIQSYTAKESLSLNNAMLSSHARFQCFHPFSESRMDFPQPLQNQLEACSHKKDKIASSRAYITCMHEPAGADTPCSTVYHWYGRAWQSWTSRCYAVMHTQYRRQTSARPFIVFIVCWTQCYHLSSMQSATISHWWLNHVLD